MKINVKDYFLANGQSWDKVVLLVCASHAISALQIATRGKSAILTVYQIFHGCFECLSPHKFSLSF